MLDSYQSVARKTEKSSSEKRKAQEEMALIQRCKEGDQAAFELLIARYRDSIYRFAYSLCANYDDVNDIVAQVYYLLYHRIHTFRGEASFSSWLFRVVKNVYVDTCVRSSRNNYISLDDPLVIDGDKIHNEVQDTASTPEESLLQKERSWRLNHAILHLPEYQRTVMIHHADGKSHEEISQLTGLSIGTIKSRLNRARTSLRERLSHVQDLFLVS